MWAKVEWGEGVRGPWGIDTMIATLMSTASCLPRPGPCHAA